MWQIVTTGYVLEVYEMNFDEHQKEIIKTIDNGTVFDILSFVKEFGYYEVYKVDKHEIETAFAEQEKGKTYPIIKPSSGSQIFNNHTKLAEDIENKPAKLFYRDTNVFINCREQKFTYDLCSDNGICISTSFDEIKNFIALWEYLKNELDVLEVKKNLDCEEVGLFFQKKANPQYFQGIEQDNNMIPIDLFGFRISNDSVTLEETQSNPVYAIKYIETILECDYDKLNVCEYYLDKKIIPTPALRNFIASDFSTPDQIATKDSLKAAWIAIGISIVATLISVGATLFSIYATYNVDPSEDNLKVIQEQLDNIFNELQDIDGLKYDDSRLIEELEEIEDIINNASQKE